MLYITNDYGERYIPDYIRITERQKVKSPKQSKGAKSRGQKEFEVIRALEAAGLIVMDAAARRDEEARRRDKERRRAAAKGAV